MKVVSCSIVGLTYMDLLNLVPSTPHLRGEDPCKPLYWYPRQIPDYCYAPKPDVAPMPLPLPPPPPPMLLPLPPPPMPLPLPMPPPPMPLPMPMYLPMPGPLALPPPIPGLMPLPQYAAPAPMPLGSPAYPPNLLPGPIQRGLVPGVEGLVSPDGAINILPFSDAYSELLEKHKQKMIRRRLQKLLDEYEYHPKKKHHRSHGWMDH
ncbi:inverted formin-2-like isoform X2 [Cydia fagiglandana]